MADVPAAAAGEGAAAAQPAAPAAREGEDNRAYTARMVDGIMPYMSGIARTLHAPPDPADRTVQERIDAAVNPINTTLQAINNRLTAIEAQLTTMDGKITTMDGKITTMDGKITTMDGKITTMDGKITTMDGKITTMDGKITTMDGKITTMDGKITTIDAKVTTLEETVGAVRTSQKKAEARFANHLSRETMTARLRGNRDRSHGPLPVENFYDERTGEAIPRRGRPLRHRVEHPNPFVLPTTVAEVLALPQAHIEALAGAFNIDDTQAPDEVKRAVFRFMGFNP